MIRLLTKLKWNSYTANAMGHGLVGFNLTDAEKAKGAYDPHMMFVHDEDVRDRKRFKDGQFVDPMLEERIAKDCADLAALLNKFHIVKEYFKDPDPNNRT